MFLAANLAYLPYKYVDEVYFVCFKLERLLSIGDDLFSSRAQEILLGEISLEDNPFVFSQGLCLSVIRAVKDYLVKSFSLNTEYTFLILENVNITKLKVKLL